MAQTPGRKSCAPRRKTPDENGQVTHVRYSQAVTKEICRRLAEGELWHRIANTDNLPSYPTLFTWLRKYPDFKEQYELAREMAADLKAEKALAVAEATTPATVSADRLKVSTLHWHAAKGNPRRYGRKAEEAPKAQAITVYVRQFERVVGEDGQIYVREIPREPPRRRR